MKCWPKILFCYLGGVNHLAHLYLGRGSAEEMVGQFIADAVKGPLDNQFTEGIRKGIRLHRLIDEFTDTHPVVLQLRAEYRGELGLYSSVVIDMIFDYWLAHEFAQHTKEELVEFADFAMHTLSEFESVFPERMHRFFQYMKQEKWLLAYGNDQGMSEVIFQMSKRYPRAEALGLVAHDFLRFAEMGKPYFLNYWPELVSYVEKQRFVIGK